MKQTMEIVRLNFKKMQNQKIREKVGQRVKIEIMKRKKGKGKKEKKVGDFGLGKT